MHGTFDVEEIPRHRVIRRHSDWTLKEHEVVVSYWPDIAAIQSALPHRSRAAIQNFAGKCNLRRPLHIWTQPEDQLLRRRVRENVPRQAIAKEMGLTLNQVANRMAYTGIRYGRRPPVATSDPLMTAIFQRAFDLNFSRGDLDEMCKSGSRFRQWSAAKRIPHKHLLRVIEELGGRVVPEWDVQ